MGLFNLFKKPSLPDKPSSPDLGAFKAAFAAYKKATSCVSTASYPEIITICDTLLDIIPTINETDIIRTFKIEGENNRDYYYHQELGILSGHKPYLVDLRESVQRKRNQAVFEFGKSEEYRENLESIPLANILIDPSDQALTRKSLSDMPEIKYSNVTKTFNRDKLPCFTVIDTETTGLKVQSGRIIELSAIRYEDFQPVSAWSTLINPGKAIPADASEVNGITNEMVANAPSLSQVAASFIEFIGASPLVGYNLPFDLKFLFAHGIDLVSQKRKYFDALELSRKAYKNELEQFSLKDVSTLCRIYPHSAHRSLADCYTTALVFQNCIDDITEG